MLDVLNKRGGVTFLKPKKKKTQQLQRSDRLLNLSVTQELTNCVKDCHVRKSVDGRMSPLPFLKNFVLVSVREQE